MSYHGGITPAAARLLRCQPVAPYLRCDACGVVAPVESRFTTTAPPGWRLVPDTSPGGERLDYCPRCAA